MLDTHVKKFNGYVEISPPIIVNENVQCLEQVNYQNLRNDQYEIKIWITAIQIENF